MVKERDSEVDPVTEFIVNLAPTGMIPTKETTPNVPISPEEIVDDVLRCHDIGITAVHVHQVAGSNANASA